MRTRRRRCLVFATHTASNYLPRLARAARRVQGPRTGTFRKLEPGFSHYDERVRREDAVLAHPVAQRTVASVAQNRLPYGSVRAYPRHRLPAAPGRRRTTCAAAFCKLHACTSRSLL